MTVDVAANLERVRDRIGQACVRAGRAPSDVTIVAVTKGVDAARIAEVIAAGVCDLGENRAQELLAKRAEIDDARVRWHFVGTLQRNKAASIAGAVALIHSVDSLRLAQEIAAHASAPQDILLQVNTSGEGSKHGVGPDGSLPIAEGIAALEGIRLRGLMTIAAPGDLEGARGEFRRLRALRDELALRVPGATDLSMGMSDDFEVAIDEGATMVRVGTAVFGVRPA